MRRVVNEAKWPPWARADGRRPAAPGEAADGDGGVGGGLDDEAVSGTNTQEEGVDEPDVVKTNGDAAYVATLGSVEVVDLTGDAPVRVGALELPVEAYSHELLLDDDVLVVLTADEGFVHPVGDAPAGTSFAPGHHYPEPVTHLTRYDVSDPVDPVLDEAVAEARRLGAYSSRAYAQTKEVLRAGTLQRVLDDVARQPLGAEDQQADHEDDQQLGEGNVKHCRSRD